MTTAPPFRLFAHATQWLVRHSVFLVALVAGWMFIFWENRFHFTPPVIVIALGYLAVVSTVYNLWRTGVAAAGGEQDEGGWGRPAGARSELEREKKTLLKAIKEAEFDHEMGKLSQRDLDEMIARYRAQAIEVIKELERMDAGQAATAREQIDREIKARLALDDKPAAKAKAKAKQAKKASAKPEDKPDAKPDAKAEAKAEAKADAKAEAKDDAKPAEPEAKPERKAGTKALGDEDAAEDEVAS